MTWARLGSGRRPSGEHSGGCGPIEGEIGTRPPPQVFLNTARSNGPQNSKRMGGSGGEGWTDRKTARRSGLKVCGVAAEDRVRCGGPYGSFRRRCLSPPGLTVTGLRTCGPKEEKGDECWGDNKEMLPLRHKVGGYGYASGVKRQVRDAGSAAPSVPKAPTRSDGEPSERICTTRVQIRSAHSLP